MRMAEPDRAITLSDLASTIPSGVIQGDSEVRISSIAFDSRRAGRDCLFVALRGGYADGHDYLLDALNSGAVAAVVEPETPPEALEGFTSVIRVSNTRAGLAPLSAAFYGQPSRHLSVIGVTGTDGKTSTSWYIRDMLEQLGCSTGLISTVSVHVPNKPVRSSARQTTPESLDVQRTLREMVDAGAEYAVLETTSHALETHRVDNCRFDVAAVTNVTQEHLDFHGSVENYRRAKGKLLEHVAESRVHGGRGIVVLNADDEGCLDIASQAGSTDILWYSRTGNKQADIQAVNIATSSDHSRFVLLLDNRRFCVRLPLPGSWNVSNCLAAVGTLHALGIAPDRIARTIDRIQPVPGRMVSVDCGQPFTVIVDYAHTPESMKSVLVEARRLASGRVLVAFGSGGERDIEKRSLQGAVAAELADYAIFTSEDPRFENPETIIEEIARGATEHGATRGVDFDCIEDREQAIDALLACARKGDVVILAGKGHEQSMIYGPEHREWDEISVARRSLKTLGYEINRDEGNSNSCRLV
jgi:UDP-N-acetylmuramoyl-L-alanyl-D-glutamate--2,6-diaminopimelate ligase